MTRSSKATLVISSNHLRADEIQSALQLAGQELVERGSKISDRPGSKVFEQSVWKLRSDLGEDLPIDQHIEFLIDLMQTRTSTLQRLSEHCSIELWCFVSSEDSQCGFALQHDLLKKVSAFRCDLVFDVYA